MVTLMMMPRNPTINNLRPLQVRVALKPELLLRSGEVGSGDVGL